MEVISWKSKLFFTEIIVLLICIRPNTFPNAFDHMEFCLVINLTMATVTWQPIFATRYVSFAPTFYTRQQVIATHQKLNF